MSLCFGNTARYAHSAEVLVLQPQTDEQQAVIPKPHSFTRQARVPSRAQHICVVRVSWAVPCQLGGHASSLCPQTALLAAWHHTANFTGSLVSWGQI